MSDKLKTFLKKNDVQLDAPQSEWREIQEKVQSRRSFSKFFLAFATGAVALVLVIGVVMPRNNRVVTEAALSDWDSGEVIESAYSYLDEEDHELVGEEYLSLLE